LTFLPHVANLSRNVIIRSANPAGTRGHVLFATRAEVDVRNALFKDLGRTTVAPLNNTTFDASMNVTHVGTNQIGRYAVHMHHVMGPSTPPSDGYQYKLIGNSIDGGKKWGIAIHNTHYGLVQGNVVYNTDGSGIATEDGSESNNVIEGNFVVRINGIGVMSRGDERGVDVDTGWEGSGIWLRGTNNFVRDNVVADALLDYGYKYFAYLLFDVKIPIAPGADTSVAGQFTLVRASSIPIKEFARNEVYGATSGGLTWWWISTQENHFDPVAQQSVVKDLRIWHVWDSGIYNYASNLITVDGLIIRGQGSSVSFSRGILTRDYPARNMRITHADIQGMLYGIVPSTNSGNGVQVIQDSYLRNAINVSIQTPWTSEADARVLPPRKVVMRNVRFDPPVTNVAPVPLRAIEFAYDANPTRNLVQTDDVYVYEFNGVVSDNFKAFYTQQAPTFVVPQTQSNIYSAAYHSLEGAPVLGQTNQQTWNTYKIAIAGSVAPCATGRPNLDGFACSIAWAPPSSDGLPPPPPPTGPAAPTNVRVY
jgi:hypothetical protein